MKITTARIGLLVGLPLTAAAAGFGPLALVRNDLPDRLATHYDASGTPDRSMTVLQFAFATGSLMTVGVVLLAAAALLSRRMPRPMVMLVAFLGGFLAGMGAGILGSEVLAQRSNTDWHEASSPIGGVIWAIVLAVVLGAAGARLAEPLPTDERRLGTAASTPSLALGSTEHAVWTGRISSALMYVLAAGFALSGLMVAVLSSWAIGLVLLAASLPILLLSHVRLQASKDGLVVRYGPIGLPRQHIGLDRIEQASAIEVRPAQWGGWGYRGSLALMKQAALVLHAGPGLRLDLADGKTFVVAVDRPEMAAAVLNGERRRADVGAQ
ncbi:MAG: DUF1648 domain-containing protein [Acidimicrobiales bacterium]